MNSPHDHRAIALAGLSQALGLVHSLATTGYLNTKSFETCLTSLFITNPEQTLDVYGGDIGQLEKGLEQLQHLISQRTNPTNKHLIQYAVGIHTLTKRLLKDNRMLDKISTRLDEAKKQSEHFGGLNHDNVIANIADIYSSTISTYSYRIQVKGEHSHLNQKRVADQIRTLLLAAIRAAILWRQTGGTPFNLVFNSGKLLAATEELLEQSKKSNLSKT
ncbi:MAG: high frequency lysogenization protein HflD [Marinagarivorans sp.]|nr:high frequency lysogenization protein HflD [Marinagarivorans sp.]